MNEELLDRVRELSRVDFTTLPSSVKEEIETLYIEVIGKRMRRCRCKDKYRDAVFEMYAKLKKTAPMENNCSYKLKRGVVFDWKGVTYSNLNLTDEVAREVAKLYPKRFEVIPVEEVAPVEEQAEEVVFPRRKRTKRVKEEA